MLYIQLSDGKFRVEFCALLVIKVCIGHIQVLVVECFSRDEPQLDCASRKGCSSMHHRRVCGSILVSIPNCISVFVNKSRKMITLILVLVFCRLLFSLWIESVKSLSKTCSHEKVGRNTMYHAK